MNNVLNFYITNPNGMNESFSCSPFNGNCLCVSRKEKGFHANGNMFYENLKFSANILVLVFFEFSKSFVYRILLNFSINFQILYYLKETQLHFYYCNFKDFKYLF